MANFQNIRLEKGMYQVPGGVCAALEQADPSENYKGTSLEGLDAFQRQLKRFDIKVMGRNSDPVAKFFSTSDSSVLFPEYISRTVRTGMEEADILGKLIATVTKIDSLDYRALSLLPDDDEKELKTVGEGAQIPSASIALGENLVQLHKRGRILSASYEAIKYQKLDVFTIMLRQIGAHIARSQAKDAIDALSSIAADVESTSEDGITYADIVKTWNALHPYNMTTLVASITAAEKLLAIPEFMDATAGLNFHATGKLITPLGAELVKSFHAPANKILAFDKSCTLEMVQAGDITTEFDKLIDRQLERAAITVTAGFSPLSPDSCVALNI